MRGIIFCTCWKSRIQYLSNTFTGASLGQRGETESRISVVFTRVQCVEETRECSWDKTLIIQCSEFQVSTFTVFFSIVTKQ